MAHATSDLLLVQAQALVTEEERGRGGAGRIVGTNKILRRLLRQDEPTSNLILTQVVACPPFLAAIVLRGGRLPLIIQHLAHVLMIHRNLFDPLLLRGGGVRGG